ncbi:MAG: hypothetical protein JJV98_19510, partial [Desulfosarcina sp.]|nr:hypothetical protein [Desulfobacterales bacterium]
RQPGTHTLDRLKVAVHGQSFATPAVRDNLARNYPEPLPGYFNIGLLHTSLTGREGHENYAPCTLEDLRNRGYDYWALGHIHQFESVWRDPPVVFPGCIQGRNIRETGAKGSILVTVKEGLAPEIVSCPHDVIRWEQLAVGLDQALTPQSSLDAFKDNLASLIDRHAPLPVIVRVTFTGKTEAHTQIGGDLDYWKEAVRSTAVAHFGARAWVEKVTVRTQPPDREGEAAADPGPLLELARLVADLRTDDDHLLTLGAALSPLFRKLPAEYRQGDSALNPENPERLREIVDQAHALLVQGLKKKAPGA